MGKTGHILTFPPRLFQLILSMMKADHRFNSFFLQSALKLLKRLVVCIELIIPDGRVVVFIDDLENPIILSRTVDLNLDGLAVSRYRLAVF